MRHSLIPRNLALISLMVTCAVGCSDSSEEDDNDSPGDSAVEPGSGGSSDGQAQSKSPSTGGRRVDPAPSTGEPGSGGSSGGQAQSKTPSTGGRRVDPAPSTGSRQNTGTGGANTGGNAATGGAANAPSAYVPPCNGVTVPPEKLAEELEDKCEQTQYMSEPFPVDLFIMMDRSVSTTELVVGADYTRWEGMRRAVEGFVTDEEVKEKEIRMGINFFSHTGGFTPDIDCDINNYTDPSVLGVPMGSVKDEAHGQAILDAMDAIVPGGQTPTMPALQGALQYAKHFNATSGQGRAQAVVLVTDGLPTQCQETLSVPEIAEKAAEAYLTEPSVRTFVVGIGPALSNLHQIARNGGTHEAYLIEEGDAVAQFVDALKKISLSAWTCEFGIPSAPHPGEQIDFDTVRMRYTPDLHQPDVVQEIPFLSSPSGCMESSGGWFYDNPEAPSKVAVCPCTCSLIRVGFVDVQYGCLPIGR